MKLKPPATSQRGVLITEVCIALAIIMLTVAAVWPRYTHFQQQLAWGAEAGRMTRFSTAARQYLLDNYDAIFDAVAKSSYKPLTAKELSKAGYLQGKGDPGLYQLDVFRHASNGNRLHALVLGKLEDNSNPLAARHIASRIDHLAGYITSTGDEIHGPYGSWKINLKDYPVGNSMQWQLAVWLGSFSAGQAVAKNQTAAPDAGNSNSNSNRDSQRGGNRRKRALTERSERELYDAAAKSQIGSLETIPDSSSILAVYDEWMRDDTETGDIESKPVTGEPHDSAVPNNVRTLQSSKEDKTRTDENLKKYWLARIIEQPGEIKCHNKNNNSLSEIIKLSTACPGKTSLVSAGFRQFRKDSSGVYVEYLQAEKMTGLNSDIYLQQSYLTEGTHEISYSTRVKTEDAQCIQSIALCFHLGEYKR